MTIPGTMRMNLTKRPSVMMISLNDLAERKSYIANYEGFFLMGSPSHQGVHRKMPNKVTRTKTTIGEELLSSIPGRTNSLALTGS